MTGKFVVLFIRTDKDLEGDIDGVYGPFDSEDLAMSFIDGLLPNLPLRYAVEPLNDPTEARSK
jgi:hypothetical protein